MKRLLPILALGFVLSGSRAVAAGVSALASGLTHPGRPAPELAGIENWINSPPLGPDDARPGARLSRNFFGQIGLGRSPGFSLVRGGSDAPVAPGVLEFEHAFEDVRSCGPVLFARGVETARALGTRVEDVDQVLPHQANGRLRELLAPFLGIDEEQVFVNGDRVGNTGSAAIWLALADVRRKLAPGQRALALGAEATKYMFGGFTYVHG